VIGGDVAGGRRSSSRP